MGTLQVGDRVLVPVPNDTPDTSPSLARGVITAIGQRGSDYYQVELVEPATYYFAGWEPPQRVWNDIPAAHLWPGWDEPGAGAD